MANTKINLHIHEAKELTAADWNGSSDPYCIITIPGSEFKARSKTVKRSLQPQWDEDFSFGPVDVYKCPSLRIDVMDYDALKTDDPLGWCEIALDKLTPNKPYHVWLNLQEPDQGQVRVRIEVDRGVTVPKENVPTQIPAPLPKEPPASVVTTPRVVSTITTPITSQGNTPAVKNVSSTFVEQIIRQCQQTNSKYEDPEFPAADSSIYKRPPGQHSHLIVWKRPNEIAPSPQLIVDGVESGDVIQGALGDCYFLGAISVVATRKDLLMPLFVGSYPEYGFYQIKFFKDGEWRVITIDDRIPCYGGMPIYGRCKDINEMWVPLIEKAYAKLHRCYEALNSGSIASALTDLTGEGCQTISFEEAAVQQQIQNGRLWQTMLYCVEENFLMGCSNNDENANAEADTGMGILKNHAYGLLDCKEPYPGMKLVCVRNPWGRLEWKGRYSDGSKEWTPDLIAKLNVKFEDDGTFWMCLEDFIAQYNSIIILRLLQDDIGKKWTKSSFEYEWRKPYAGGCMNNVTWHDNPQYLLRVNRPSKAFISLVQPDVRLKWELDYEYGIGLYLLKTKNPNIVKLTYDKSEIVAKATFTPSREVSMDADLEPGVDYVVIPATFQPNQEIKYWLDIYTEEDHTCRRLASDYASSEGGWFGPSAGGCYNHDTWVNNPKYRLSALQPITQDTPVTLLLRQQDRPQKYFIGMYAGHHQGKVPSRNEIQSMSTCVNARQVTLDITLRPGQDTFYVIPVAYEPGQEGNFQLFAYSTAKLQFGAF